MASGGASGGTISVKVVPDFSEFREQIGDNTVLSRIMRRYAHDLLFQYSEWLDSQGVVRSEKQSKDNRSHDQLVRDFLAH
jgi:hypothetical protein